MDGLIASGPLVQAGPVNLSPPVVTRAVIGQAISHTPGDWDGALAIDYQFRRDGIALAEWNEAYTPDAADAGRGLYVVERAVDTIGLPAFAVSASRAPRLARAPIEKRAAAITEVVDGQPVVYDEGLAIPGAITRIEWTLAGSTIAVDETPTSSAAWNGQTLGLEVTWSNDGVDLLLTAEIVVDAGTAPIVLTDNNDDALLDHAGESLEAA